MKKLITLSWIVIFGIAFMGIPTLISHGQTEAEGSQNLVLQHSTDTAKTFVIDKGDDIKVWKRNGQSVRGILRSVTDSTYFLGDKEVSISDTERIKLEKGEGSVVGGAVGLVVGIISMLLGLAMGLLGVNAIDNAPGNANGCGQAFGGFLLVILGILIGALGFVFFIIGIVAFAVGNAVGRTFQIPDKWRIRGRK